MIHRKQLGRPRSSWRRGFIEAVLDLAAKRPYPANERLRVRLGCEHLDERAVPATGFRLVETIVVPSNGDAVTSLESYEAGNYKLVITGDIETSDGVRSDAEWSDFTEDSIGRTPDDSGIRIGGDDEDFGPYCPGHIYPIDLIIDSKSKISLSYFEEGEDYGDNSGDFTAEIYEPLDPEDDPLDPEDEIPDEATCPADTVEPEDEPPENPESGDDRSDSGVDYSDGGVDVSDVGFMSDGFGFDWGASWTFTNDPGEAYFECGDFSGTGTGSDQMPAAREISDSAISISFGGGTARVFDATGSGYQSRYASQNTLVVDAGGDHDLVLTDVRGAKYRFYSLSHSEAMLRGKLKNYTDPYGTELTVNRDSDNYYRVESMERHNGSSTQTFNYNYLADGKKGAGLLDSIEWEQDAATVRSLKFSYHDGSTDAGSAGNLRSATVFDADDNAIETVYYRHYTTADYVAELPGYNNGMQFVIRGPAFERMMEELNLEDLDDVDAESDENISPYADAYFEFDAQHRISAISVQGDGCSTCSGGLGTYSFEYEKADHGAPLGFNRWAMKTTETLPDGNKNIVYTNGYGQVMLFIHEDVATGQQWLTNYMYDGLGKLLQKSNPSAVTGYDDTKPELMTFNGVRLGIDSEFLVNTRTTGAQNAGVIARDWAGNSVIAWVSDGQDGNSYGIYAQRFNAAGTSLGSEFRVNSHTADGQIDPALAMDADGDFVVVWTSYQDGDGYGVYAQRYDRNGATVGAEFLVNTTTGGSQLEPAVAMDGSGDFAIVWSDYTNVYMQRYNASGTPDIAGETVVNSTTTHGGHAPAIAMDKDGNFAVTWTSVDGSGAGVYARNFDEDGNPIAGEFRVNTTTSDAQFAPAIAMDINGDFVIAWTSYVSPTYQSDVYAQRYEADGTPDGANFLVNTSITTAYQELQTVAMSARGEFVVAWTSSDGGLDKSFTGVFAQYYSASGTPGSPFKVNDYTTSIQRRQAIASDYDGNFVVTWDSANQDGSSYGVFARPLDRSFSYLSDSVGLIERYHYGRATTATTGAAGDAAGYFKSAWLARGELDTGVKQSANTYIKRTVSSDSTFAVAATTVYRNDEGTGDQTTSYTYSWYSGTFGIESVEVTMPTATTGQNGPGSAAVTTTYFDEVGRPIWSKDAAGSISYTAYDAATGGIVRTIVDVDTDTTSDFSGLPGGWSSKNGLHLKSDMEVDDQGRTVKLTDPRGKVTFTVYKDATHQVRIYPGWTGSATTGPTVVTIENQGRRYTDTLTMTATPTVSSSRPTGTEKISGIQTLSRTSVNAASQVVVTDSYFDLSGLDYDDQTQENTGHEVWHITDAVEGENYYRTSTDYDQRGRVKRVQSPTGTITWTLYDSLSRVTSTWVGTEDTLAWSPANPADSNLVQTAAYVYDGGGVGDGNLTVSTSFPGQSAARVTFYAHDWRNRQVAVKTGALSAAGSPTISLAAATYTTNELDQLLVWVTLSAAADHPVTVNYATKDGSATTTDADYEETKGTLTIPAGQVTRSIAIPILDSGSGDESFTLSLSSPGGAALGATSVTTVTIDRTSGDTVLQFSASAVKVHEAAGFARVIIRDPVAGSSFSYALSAGSASANSDFTTVEGTHVFREGETSFDIPLPIINDANVEGSETCTLTIYGATSLTLGGSTTIPVTIVDDDFAASSESTSDNLRVFSYVEYDNLGQAIYQESYDGDKLGFTWTSGVPDRPLTKYLRSKTSAEYDELGRVYRSSMYGVTYDSGADSVTVSSITLDTQSWYDIRGNVIRSQSPGAAVQIMTYDGAGRMAVSYTTDGYYDGKDYSTYLSVDDDVVYEQAEYTYDAAGNVVRTDVRQRGHGATTKGALYDLSEQKSLVTHRLYSSGTVYDNANRVTKTIDVGTNGGDSWDGTSEPTGSLVVTMAYNGAGWVSDVTDPRGLVSHLEYDNLGRTLKQYESYAKIGGGDYGDFDAGNPSLNRLTVFTYDGASHLVAYAARFGDGGSDYQITAYTYGVDESTGSLLANNDLLYQTEYPVIGVGPAPTQFQYQYDAAGAVISMRDNVDDTVTNVDNVHAYTYDVLGRMGSDAVVTLGSDVDDTVLRIATGYDTFGRAFKFTSYDAASAGDVVNEVVREFNMFGQVTVEWQEHTDEVDGGSEKVLYTYSEGSGGNHSRLTSIIYPNSRTVEYSYGDDSLTANRSNDAISRLTSIGDGSITLESFSYLGLGTVVARTRPENEVDLSMPNTDDRNDGGDSYGLDRFGRVTEMLWHENNAGNPVHLYYGYDANGNRLFKDDLENDDFDELYHSNGAAYGYDDLNQLTDFRRGELSDGNSDDIPDTITTSSLTQAWAPDALGNFTSVDTSATVNESRTHNGQNQLTEIVIDKGASTTTVNLDYDGMGNLIDDDTRTFIYDAWNRMVQVDEDPHSAYDGLSRRIVEGKRDLYYSTQWQVLEEHDEGDFKYSYAWSPVYVDALIARDDDKSARLYALNDANWNVVALVETDADVDQRFVYDPYGRTDVYDDSYKGTSDGFDWAYRHQGGRWDDATELYGFRHRDYSPALMRWIRQDPLESTDTNKYQSVLNTPVSLTDPIGLAPWITIEDAAKPTGAQKGFGLFWPVNFKFRPPAPSNGFLIQKIELTYKAWKTGDKDDSPTGKLSQLEKKPWLETWEVGIQSTQPSDVHDFVISARVRQRFKVSGLSRAFQLAASNIELTLPKGDVQFFDQFSYASDQAMEKEIADQNICKIEFNIKGLVGFSAVTLKEMRNKENGFRLTKQFGASNSIYSSDKIEQLPLLLKPGEATVAHELSAVWTKATNKTEVRTKPGALGK